MPMGKGTYGSKKGRPPKKTKMASAKKGTSKLAAMYGNKKKVTRGDIIAAAKKNKRSKA